MFGLVWVCCLGHVGRAKVLVSSIIHCMADLAEAAATCRPRDDTLRGTHCRCTQQLNTSSSEGFSASSWGLPSVGCPGNWTSFFVHEYPRLHAEWRKAGRVVVHCSMHTGLGNWLQGVGAALAYSLATAQALSLRCDKNSVLKFEAGRVVRLHEHLARYFRSPHFDWDFDPPALPKKKGAARRTVDLSYSQHLPGKWAWNTSGGTRVITSMNVHVARVLKFSRAHWVHRFDGREQAEAMLRTEPARLSGCLLRYLFAPTPTLAREVQEATGVVPDPTGLMPLAALHVRAGDAHLLVREHAFNHRANGTATQPASHGQMAPPFNHTSARKPSRLGSDVRTGGGQLQLYQSSPNAVLECLQRLSELRDGSESHECVGCVVLSDSPWVTECGRRGLARPVTLPGDAVHLGASSKTASTTALNVGRIFLDWFLLAQSRATLHMSPSSTFASTAALYRVASAASPSRTEARWAAPSHESDAIGGAWPHLLVHERFMPLLDLSANGTSSEESIARWWRNQCRPFARGML